MSGLNNPSIDQAAKMTFEQTFWKLAQQTQSKLANSKAIKYLPSNGKTHNLSRMGGLELTEVSGRNPDKVYSDYGLDNRMLTKRRFTVTVQIDKKDDINELLKDPTSDIMTELLAAKNRVTDRVIAAAASGDVLCGRPDRAPTVLTAANDGVVTIDATGGLNYNTVTQITQKFINNNLEMSLIEGAQFLITGKENTELMNEDKFINNDYISAKPVESGSPLKTSIYQTVLFAGSEAGGITVPTPILQETATERTCLVLAPQSVALAMELGGFDIDKAPNKVNSLDLTIDLWINAMRTEGARVIAVKTTK